MEKMRKFFSYILFSLLIYLITINVTILIQAKVYPDDLPNVLGYKPLIVLSGSMKQTFDVGDLIFIKEDRKKNYAKGDIITFKEDDDYYVSHRIYAVVDGDQSCYLTKGDNNAVVDQRVVCSNDIIGKYKFKIPFWGKVILFVQEPFGFFMFMLFVVLICVLLYISYLDSIKKGRFKKCN